MPTYENVEYLRMPQQVQKNRNDIKDLVVEDTTLQENIDVEKTRNDGQDNSIEDINEEIAGINEVLASGGILVSRRVESSALTTGSGSTVKMIYDVTQKESNDLTIVAFDANNDHILKRDGTYTVNAGFSMHNAANQPKNFTLQLVSIDTVTSAEVVVDSRSGSIPALTTLPINPSFDFERPVGNDILLVVRQNMEDVNVTVAIGASLSVTSQFTIAGSGIATKTKNIGPTNVVNEGVLETEDTLEEILTNLKALLIEHDVISRNTLIKRNGVDFIQLSSDSHVYMVGSERRLRNVGAPSAGLDAVNKAFIDVMIQLDGVNLDFQGNRGKNIAAPVDPLDIVNKTYSDLKLLLTGGTLTGALTVLTPTADLHPATKKYVDDGFAAETEGVAADGVLTIDTNAYEGHECKKVGSQVSVTCILTGSCSIGNTVFSLPAGFRPNVALVGTVHLLGSTTEFKVTINTIGTVVALEAITSGDKSVSFNYNVV